MRNGFPAPNKELAINRKTPLDREGPIQVRIQSPPAVSQANFRIAPLARPDLVERLATPFIASPGSATTLSLSRPHLPVTKATSYPIARGSQIPITQRAAPFYLCRPAVSSLETYQTPALGACLTVK